jgi:hypothetical protein
MNNHKYEQHKIHYGKKQTKDQSIRVKPLRYNFISNTIGTFYGVD